jgi:hypothetical protein
MRKKNRKTKVLESSFRYNILIRSKKFTKKKQPEPANEISEDDINKLITSIKKQK